VLSRIASSKSSGSVIPAAAAITGITLWRANEQYNPASRNQGCPAGSIRKSNRL
jgi:hypothetical protein